MFADIDGDSDLDILITNENPFPFGPPGDFNRILINDGSGAFTDETFTRLPVQSVDSADIAAGDLDGDGDLDLFEGNTGAQNRVLINTGFGFFTDETAARLPALVDSTRKVALGDVDGDGDLDAVVGNSRVQQNRLYLNDGNGVFSDASANLGTDLETTTDVKLEDVDADGDLDLLVINVGDFVFGHGFLGEPNRLLLGDGNGLFTDATFPRLEQRNNRSTNAEFGDLDGNGTIDLIVANSGGVDQPGLPAPDGAEELFLRIDCAADQSACLALLIAEMQAAVAILDTAPGGDMTSSIGLVNQIRRQWMLSLLRLAENREPRRVPSRDRERDALDRATSRWRSEPWRLGSGRCCRLAGCTGELHARHGPALKHTRRVVIRSTWRNAFSKTAS